MMKKDNYVKSLILILTFLFPAAIVAHDFEVNGIYYNVNGNEATVTYRGTSSYEYYDEYSGYLNIPTSVTYNGTTYSVTCIGTQAFMNCKNLTGIMIPNSVTSIGDYAFAGCSGLTSIMIPNSVTSIGDHAFWGCTGLTSIMIPNSVTSIGDHAFDSCTGLTGLKVESGNAVYDSRNNCNAIIETSRNTLIAGCKNTMIPNSVTSIGIGAFAGCSGLTSIMIPNSVTSIGDHAFWGCTGLTSIMIPNSVTSIGTQAFVDCSGLTGIMIPNSVTSIGDYAFAGCSGLTSIMIPNSVTSTGIGVFAGCSGLTGINVESGNAIYDSRDNCNAIIETSSNTLIAGCKNTMIPNSVTKIGINAFENFSGLTSIIIPTSVTSIGNGAFASCTGLTSIVIPNSVTSIGIQAFVFCSGLTSIVIPNSVTSIGAQAFIHCSGLTRADIGNSMTSIGEQAFLGTGLNNVYCYSSMPSSCTDNCFSDYSATLHVPAASIAAYFTASCWSNFDNIIGDAVVPTGISISKDSANLQLDEQLQLTAAVTPANASNKEIIWLSTNTSVATVNNGTVHAVGCGECDIIASCFGLQVMCHILVANRITLDQQEAMLLPNHILTLTPTPTVPGGYIVSSSDPTVAAARVVSDGKVQVVGIKEGTTTITVDSADGTAIPAKCLVTVYTEPGDLNSDGFVNISDVTSLIDYLLGGDETSVTMKNADVNGDGKINIADVTSLIDTLLSKTE